MKKKIFVVGIVLAMIMALAVGCTTFANTAPRTPDSVVSEYLY